MDKKPTYKVLLETLATVGMLVALIFGVFSTKLFSPNDVDKKLGVLFSLGLTNEGLVAFSVVITSILATAIWYIRKSKKKREELKLEIEELQGTKIKELIEKKEILEKRLEKPVPTFKRFEQIINANKINYSYLEYTPFFYINNFTESGIGKHIVEEIFKPFKVIPNNIKPQSGGYNWDSIFSELDKNNSVHMIALPMYETRSRIYDYDVLFCSPLFYSDIGIYLRYDDYREEYGDKKLKYSEAIKFLNNKVEENKWEPATIEGELSEIFAHKLFDTKKSEINHSVSKDADFENLLKSVNDARSKGDFVFMEVFKAEHFLKKKGNENLKLVNILENSQIVYPVSFVVKKEETVLRNFLNFRIQELKNNGFIKKIIRDESKKYGIHSDLNKKFKSEYDFKLLDENYYDAPIIFNTKAKDEYDILENVYGNFIGFQEGIKDKLSTLEIDKEKLEVLDIGCGTGYTSQIILDSRNDINLTALDNDSDMIKYSEKNVSTGRHNSIKFVENDILYFLETTDQRFDVIVSAYTIHNFTNQFRERLIPLIFKKLNPGGIFINADKYASDNVTKRTDALQYRISKWIQTLFPLNKIELLDYWVSHYINDMTDERVMTVLNSENLYTKTGFKEIEFDDNDKEIEMMVLMSAKKPSP